MSWYVMIYEQQPLVESSDFAQDAITGSSARVCMVAAVHPAHAVETDARLMRLIGVTKVELPTEKQTF